MFLDPDHALAQARAADALRLEGKPIGPLHGVPVRPAAYCGVIRFKPTHGLISRHHVFALSRRLDHVGLFACSVDDIALLAEQLIAYDENGRKTFALRALAGSKSG